MRGNYVDEANEIYGDMITVAQGAIQEMKELDERFVHGDESSDVPLGKKFLLHRGQEIQMVLGKLEKFLSDHY